MKRLKNNETIEVLGFTNFVFAESPDEMERKLRILKQMNQLSANYNKLTIELHPMAY